MVQSQSTRQRGQTLVEMLVVIGLSAIMLPALATAMVASREGRAQESERMQAAALLNEADEAVRSIREKGWTNIAVNGTYSPTVTGSVWSLAAGPETVGSFTRSIVIADVQRDSSGGIVASGGTVDSSTKKVVTTVSWTTPIASSLTNESYYSRHLNNNAWTHTSQADFSGTKVNTTATPSGQVELTTGGGGGGIAFVQTAASNNDAGATTIAQAFSARVTGGNTIIVAVSWDTSAGGTSLTCTDTQNNTYANATNVNDATNSQALAVCYAPNVAGGNTTVTATFTGSATFRRIIVNEYSGIATTAPVDATRTNIAEGTAAIDNITSLAATTTVPGDLIFGAVMDDTNPNTSIDAGTGFTRRNITSTQLMVEDRTQPAAGSIAATATFGTAHRYLAHVVAFKAATAGSGVAWSNVNRVSALDFAGAEDALDVFVSGNYAYIADSTVLRIVDISNPITPTLTGSYTAPGAINSISVSGNTAFLATAGNTAEMVVVNVTNKASPSLIINYDVGGLADMTSIFISGTLAYLGRVASATAGENEFYIINIANPASPSVSGSLNLTATVNSVHVNGNFAYLATSVTTAELTIVNVTTPAAPTQAGVYDAVGTSIATDVFAVGTTAYLTKANNTSGAEFFIINAATPATPTLVGTHEAGANVNGVYVSGTTAFLATAVTNSQFRALNIATPASPTVASSLNQAGVANDITFNGTNVFMATALDTRELTLIQQVVVSGGGYQPSGTYESPTFDAGVGNNYAYNYITFGLTEPTDTNVTFQVAVNNDGSTWSFVGPDGTAGSNYTAPIALRLNTTGRYFRYKATLTSNPGLTATPAINDVSVNYSP